MHPVRFPLLVDNWSIVKDFPHFMVRIRILRFLGSFDIHISCQSHQGFVHWLHHHALFKGVPDRHFANPASRSAVRYSGDVLKQNLTDICRIMAAVIVKCEAAAAAAGHPSFVMPSIVYAVFAFCGQCLNSV